ncbi:MAG: ribose-5-phosphate isomerase RpiA [Gammaproteobacteria bacterium]
MDQNQKKVAVGRAALEFVTEGAILGVGTGSTVNAFIDALGAEGPTIAGAVSSSNASTEKLTALGIPVVDLNTVGHMDIYVDGADETDSQLNLIKGGGAALTREKIVASAASTFVCIVDDSKLVKTLGAFPLPVEVIPMARSLVARQIDQLGGRAEYRDGVVTDNHCHILDVHGLHIDAPAEFEARINQIPGVVTVGLFAQRGADELLIAGDTEVRHISRPKV